MGVEDAVLFMLHQSLSFLDGAGGYVGQMFFDSDEGEYSELVTAFTDWSKRKGLILNGSKTKKMIFDFWRNPTHQPVTKNGQSFQVVHSYKYLGIHLDHKLDWAVETTAVYKGQKRQFFLRKQRSLDVSSEMLRIIFPLYSG